MSEGRSLREALGGLGAGDSVRLSLAGTDVTIYASGWRYDNEYFTAYKRAAESDHVIAQLFPPDEVQCFQAVADLGKGIPISGIAALMTELLGSDLWHTPNHLPEGPDPDLRLIYLGAAIDKNNLADLMLRFELGKGQTIPIVPDFLSIGDLNLQVGATYPFDPKRATLEVEAGGRIAIGKAEIRVVVKAEDDQLLRTTPPLEQTARDDLAKALAEEAAKAASRSEPTTEASPLPSEDDLKQSLKAAAETAPPRPFSRYVVHGNLLQSGEELGLADVLSHFGLADAGLGIGARIVEADFFYDGWTRDYALTLGIGGRIENSEPPSHSGAEPRRGPALEIIKDKLTIETLLMEVRGSAETGAVEGMVRGELHVGDAILELEASCSTSTGGLIFSGGWTRQDPRVSDLKTTETILENALKESDEDDQDRPTPADLANPKPLGGNDLDGFLQDSFGIELDDTLKTLQIDEIGLTIRTAEQAFEFGIDGHMQLALGQGDEIGVEASVRIDIHRDAEGFVGRFRGVVVVRPDPARDAAFELDLEVLREPGATALLAGFRDTTLGESDEQEAESGAGTAETGDSGDTNEPNDGGDTMDLSVFDASQPSALAALARKLGYEKVAGILGGDDGLMLAVREFFVATRSEDGEGGRASIIGVDIGAGLDFTRIDPPDLPLIGVPDLSGLPRLGLHLKAAYLAGTGDRAALTDFASRGGYSLPQGEGDVLIEAVVRIGDGTLSSAGKLSKEDLDRVEPQGGAGKAEAANGVPKGVALGTDATWLPIQRSFGPVTVRRIGLSLATDGPLEVTALLDAGLVLGGLAIGLDGLSVTSPISGVSPRFGLEGLSLDYSTPTFEIGGALLLRGNEFRGAVVVRAEEITIVGSGAFSELTNPDTHEKHPSFYASAVVSYPLGGPAFFFVEGFSGAFGYNRSVAVPPVEEVLSFPLVRQAAEAAEGKHGGPSSDHDPERDFAAIPAVLGENFVAVGLQFTSFKLITSAAVLLVREGAETEIALLGVSTFRNPPITPATALAEPIAYVRVLWEAVFRPARGTFELRADIAEGAFVLDRRCRIGGGLALCCWFADDPQNGVSAGEFVLTLGGYHPNFRVPAAFPRVAALQLHWQVNENLTIKGSAFFALTSGAIMAGGALRASWTSENLKATFSAEAAFLAMWRPHHYEATIAVNIHAEAVYTAIFTYHLSFDAAARLEVWGPDFSGTALIDVHILGFDVSFGISFGDSPRVARAIEWAEFHGTILPAPLAALQPVSGLLSDDGGTFVFDRHEMNLAVPMGLPCRTLRLGDRDVLHERTFTAEFGIVPMGIKTLDTHVRVAVRDGNGKSVSERFIAEPILKEGPAALWASQAAIETPYGAFVRPPDPNGARVIPNLVMGLRLGPAPKQPEKLVPEPPPMLTAKPEIEATLPSVPVEDRGGAKLKADERRALLKDLGFEAVPAARPRELEEA